MDGFALNLMWLESYSTDMCVSIIYLPGKIQLDNLTFVFTYPKREDICRSASSLTRIILAEDRVWMGVGWGQDTQVAPCGLLSGVFTLPTQDANSKGALAMTV